MRRRISITIDEETYKELIEIVQDYGFESISEYMQTLLSLAGKYIHAAEHRRQGVLSDSEMIINMFNELGNWEDTPMGIPPQRRVKKTVNDGKG